ncbi:MAG: transporter substrate-binding domain-containing protein, partial [Verrucomicrobiota bacterium]
DTHTAEAWKIAVPNDAGPYSRVLDGEAGGFDLEYTEAAAQIAAQPDVEFVPVESTSAALELLDQGSVHAALAVPFDQAQQLPKDAVLSEPYRTERLQGFVRGDALIRNSHDLSAATIAAPVDSMAHRFASARGWDIVETSSWATAFATVAHGGADATICDSALASQQLLDGGYENLRPVSGLVHESPISLAISPAAIRLQNGLRAVRQTGHATYLRSRWELLAEDTTSQAAPNVDYRVLAYGVLVLIAALLVLSQTRTPQRQRNPGGLNTKPALEEEPAAARSE